MIVFEKNQKKDLDLFYKLLSFPVSEKKNQFMKKKPAYEKKSQLMKKKPSGKKRTKKTSCSSFFTFKKTKKVFKKKNDAKNFTRKE